MITLISVDDTWQKRGCTSLDGAVAAISIETGCILDVEVMTRYCQGCIHIERFTENADLHEHLKLDHVCKSNHAWFSCKNVGGGRGKNIPEIDRNP